MSEAPADSDSLEGDGAQCSGKLSRREGDHSVPLPDGGSEPQERDQLGEKITLWLAANPSIEIVDKIVTQSSDEAFHCLAITLFYNGK